LRLLTAAISFAAVLGGQGVPLFRSEVSRSTSMPRS
jgi:hypothetical protein